MHIKQLLDEWESSSHGHEAPISMTVNLPFELAARILALNELYPERTPEQIFIELLHVALDEMEEAFPYVRGEKVIAEDEFGDPVYEDVGLTPRFIELTRKYREQLKNQQKKKSRIKL